MGFELHTYFSEKRISEKFCNIMKKILIKENITLFWKKLNFNDKNSQTNLDEGDGGGGAASVGVILSSTDGAEWSTSVFDLMKYLYTLKNNSPEIFNQPNLILNTYPNLSVLIYKCIKESNLLQFEEFKIFTPFFLGTELK